MKVPAAAATKGWLETIKHKLNIDGLMQKLNLSKSRLVEIGIWLGIGFLSGFLFKKWGKYLFVVVLTLVALAFLQQFKFIDVAINWDKIQGLQPIAPQAGASMLAIYWAWVKANFAVVLSFSIGFLVGFKVG